jgi:hypothetical protein
MQKLKEHREQIARGLHKEEKSEADKAADSATADAQKPLIS